MIKKTIEISRQAVHLSARLDQLIVQPFDEPKTAARSIACEDIGVLMIDEPRCSITQGALQAVLRHGGTIVICGCDHLPAGLLLPTCSNTQQVQRLHEQINITKPTLKRLWKQVIQSKIKNQAATLPASNPSRKKLLNLAKEVRSGDTSNVEAQAARIHWAAWRANIQSLHTFRRNHDATDLPNVLLNYGYAVLRAAVARALVSAGLHPALGLHHHNRANAFCLADDLMEPLRPAVDRRVRALLQTDLQEIDQDAKAQLLHVLVDTIKTGDQTGPLMVALPRMTASLVQCYRSPTDRLLLPTLPPTLPEAARDRE